MGVVRCHYPGSVHWRLLCMQQQPGRHCPLVTRHKSWTESTCRVCCGCMHSSTVYLYHLCSVRMACSVASCKLSVQRDSLMLLFLTRLHAPHNNPWCMSSMVFHFASSHIDAAEGTQNTELKTQPAIWYHRTHGQWGVRHGRQQRRRTARS
jgi:hypothetical protein